MNSTDIQDSYQILSDINTVLYDEDGVAKHIMANAGQYSGKGAGSPISLSSHLLNVISAGLKSYVFDKLVIEGGTVDETEACLLVAGLALHDVDKYVSNSTGEATENTRATLEQYLETDDFNIQGFFEQVIREDIREYEDEILYLIQRTELSDDSLESQKRARELVQRVKPYCRFADATVSAFTVDGFTEGIRKLETKYRDDEIHQIDLTPVEHSMLSRVVLHAAKQYIHDEGHGIVFGSTPTHIVYLGEELDREHLCDATYERVRELFAEQFAFSAKAKWNTFEYSSLAMVDLPLDEKRASIFKEVSNTLENGSGLEEPVENVPPEYQDVVPELCKVVFRPDDGDTSIEAETEEIMQEFGLEEAYTDVEASSSPTALKIRLLGKFAREFHTYEENLRRLQQEYEGHVAEDLTVEESASRTVVDRMFGVPQRELSVADGSSTCFLCGEEATRNYKPGRTTIYSNGSYSRRTTPYQNEKRICEVCFLEYALVEGFIEQSPESVNASEGEMLYVTMDTFISDVQLDAQFLNRSLGGSNAASMTNKDDWEPVQYGPFHQFNIVPLVFSSRDSDKDKRMYIIRQILDFLHHTGVRGHISRPFARYDPQDYVFRDSEPIRLEASLGLDTIQNHAELERYRLLFDVLDSVERDSSYIHIETDEFIPMVSGVVKSMDNPAMDKLMSLKKYTETYHSDEFMSMREIAQIGIGLYGEEYGSKHAQTDVFRDCIEALITGLSHDLPRDELADHVAGRALSEAERKEYSGHVTSEQAEEFAIAIIDYLDQKDLLTLQDLSDWQNSLVDTYHFAYKVELDS